MREMAKSTQQLAAEARAEERRLEREVDEAESAQGQERARFWETNEALRGAEGRVTARGEAVKTLDNASRSNRARALEKEREAADVEGRDPARAADLREEAAGLRSRADAIEAEESVARAKLAEATDEVRALEVRLEETAKRGAVLSKRVEQLRAESEKAEQRAEEYDAMAKSQEMQALQLDESADTLAAEAGEPVALGSNAGLQDLATQDVAAQEVLGALESDEALDPDGGVALGGSTDGDLSDEALVSTDAAQALGDDLVADIAERELTAEPLAADESLSEPAWETEGIEPLSTDDPSVDPSVGGEIEDSAHPVDDFSSGDVA